jgi:hypothetical protein
LGILVVGLALPGFGKSFLWEVDGQAGKSYLLGSIHLLKKEMYPLKPEIEAAFTNTGALVVEADISQGKMAELSALTFKMGLYQGEDSLKAHVSEKTYNRVAGWLKENGMDITGFARFKPWMLALTITGMAFLKQGFDPNYGIDKYFMGQAEGKKDILELEGIAFQMNLFDGLSEQENDLFLFSSLEDISDSAEDIDRLVDAWSQGDAPAMERFVTENVRKYPELKGLFQKLTDERNRRMAEKIFSFLQEKRTFLVIAGAAHLVGETGIVRLLEAKGFKVRQL